MNDKKPRDNKPEILVILPTLGQRNDLLRKSLDSIRKQGNGMFDLVLVYPIANKEVAALAHEYGADSIDDPGSISEAVNVGILRSKSYHRYIAWLGDDDLLEQNSLKTSLAALHDTPRAAVAYGYCNYIDAEGKLLFVSRAGRLAPWIMTWGPNLMPLPGMLFRKSCLEEIGNFDPTKKYTMDLDVLLKLRNKRYAFINTGRVLASFRWHPDSTTVSGRKKSLQEAYEVKRSFLPTWLRPFAIIWDYPVRLLTVAATHRLNGRAKK